MNPAMFRKKNNNDNNRQCNQVVTWLISLFFFRTFDSLAAKRAKNALVDYLMLLFLINIHDFLYNLQAVVV